VSFYFSGFLRGCFKNSRRFVARLVPLCRVRLGPHLRLLVSAGRIVRPGSWLPLVGIVSRSRT